MTRITESEWIRYFGFQRFPFDRPEAGNEEFARPDFLASCFVEPDCFERILGQANSPTTALLWANRGTGKTACRVMVDYYCQEGKVPVHSTANYILSVPHIHLHRPLEIARRVSQSFTSEVLIEHHVLEILSRAIPMLVELIGHAGLEQIAQSLSEETKQELGWLIAHYPYHLIPDQAKFLAGLGLWQPQGKRQIGYSKERERPLPDLSRLEQGWERLSPLDHLARLAILVRELGIQATYILVDGVDEFTEAAGDPQQAYRVMRPLLTTLRLMDSTPYLALKYFLPDQIEPYLLNDPAFRHDRGFIIERLRWTEDDLVQILRRRLAELRINTQQERLKTGFEDLCVPELRGFVEAELVRQAQSNPRHLMLLCGLMVTAHCASDEQPQPDPYQLNRQDLETALAQFMERINGQKRSIPSTHPLSLPEMIAQGEHEQLEFKASVQWNLRTKSADSSLRIVIGRAIAGMMNRHGGTLLIGVGDDGTLLGIENDLIATKGSKDKFQLSLEDIIKTYLGLEYAAYKNVQFETLQDKLICIVEIRPTPQPVYVQENNTTEFYVRLGNRTSKLDVRAALAYIQSHWGTRT